MYDLVIVGGGGAALSCAISAKLRGLSVVVISKSSITSSQTAQAQGGINGVLDEGDDFVKYHIEDTIKSSGGLGDIDAIELMCNNAKKTILWLDTLGVPFSRDKKGEIAQRKLGGASKNRACYSSDYTGLKILHTLFDVAIGLGIEFREHSMLLDLIKIENSIGGICYLELRSSSIKTISANNTVIASGGYGGVYYNYTTNHKDTTSDGIMAGFRAGVELENMEFVQFHPTTLKGRFALISESARGEGGYLVTKDQKRFVDELLPRDIVAREIYKKISNNEDVFLDIRHLGYEKILHLLPQEYKLIFNFASLHMEQDLIPITPATHYTMGGLKCNKESKTSLNNLYVIGEAASNRVHGANRLGGNSLLEIVYFGKALGEKLKSGELFDISNNSSIESNTALIAKLFSSTPKIDFYHYKKELGKVMFENVGLFRDRDGLLKAQSFVNFLVENIDNFGISDKSKNYNTNLKELLEFRNMIFCAKAIVVSANNRDESRGSHFRTDFPLQNDNFKDSTIVDFNFNVRIGE